MLPMRAIAVVEDEIFAVLPLTALSPCKWMASRFGPLQQRDISVWHEPDTKTSMLLAFVILIPLGSGE